MDPAQTFDYLIIGGGSAGSVLAARLSEDPATSVCLLEAGGGGKSILVRAPAAAVAMLPGRPRINNWALETERQPGLNGRRGYQPRGMALGGSSAINAMLYIRGHRDDYDGWARAGCPGWGWEAVLPYFRKSENNQRGGDALHGDGGPLQVSDQAAPRPISRAFVAAAGQMQVPLVDDFNRGDTEGAGLAQVTQFHQPDRRGERCSAAAAYLFPAMRRANLTVLTGARARRILFDGKRATGVAFLHRGQAKTLQARRGVILSGGAFHSPQLLQLSGVGRPEDITPHGIAMVHALPGVGQNLQDHLDVILGWKSPDPDMFGFSLRQSFRLLRHIRRWRRDGASMIATPFAEALAFLKTAPDAPRPDLQLHFVIGIVDDHARRLHWGQGFSVHACVLYPQSRGRVFLKSPDSSAAPGIDPGFLSDKRDLDNLIRGARIARAIATAPAMAPYLGQEMFGVHAAMTSDDWERFIRARADTIYHPVGTCRMGQDAGAVVDPQLRVHGLQALWVVDASVMPEIIGGNTNAPTMMIAEKAADMIRAAA